MEVLQAVQTMIPSCSILLNHQATLYEGLGAQPASPVLLFYLCDQWQSIFRPAARQRSAYQRSDTDRLVHARIGACRKLQ